MHDLKPATPPVANRPGRLRPIARWMVTFIGFPIGGFASMLLVGPIDGRWPALLGGAVTGLFIGAAQAWGLGSRLGRTAMVRWIAASTVGMTVGLGIGAAAVGYATSLTALVIQGAICGLAVGIAQAVVLWARIGRLALAWPAALAICWGIGWAVTTLGGIAVQEQFTVFGSFGAITVTALTAVLLLSMNRTVAGAA